MEIPNAAAIEDGKMQKSAPESMMAFVTMDFEPCLSIMPITGRLSALRSGNAVSGSAGKFA
jgi:hypothetical protein